MEHFGKARETVGPTGRRGAVLLLVVLAVIVLLGMAALVVDLGQVYIARQRVQNVCDASALAGAQALGVYYGNLGMAKSEATTLASQNAADNNTALPRWTVMETGTTNPGVAISFPVGQISEAGGNMITVHDGDAIRTEGYVTVNYSFARILGFTSKQVTASSTVLMEHASQFCSELYGPLAVSDLTIFGDGTPEHQPIQFGQTIPIKVGAWQDNYIGPGNFGAVVLPGDGTGASAYRERLNGDAGSTCISNMPSLSIDTKPGNMAGPTVQGLTDRLGKETDPRFTNDATAWNNWVAAYNSQTMQFPKTWRLIILMVTVDPTAPQGGRSTVDVKGMAGFFIESVESGDTVYGRFVQGIVSGTNVRWMFPASTSPDDTQLMYTIRVVS